MGRNSGLRDSPEPDMGDIYLDYNATTPIDPQVAEAMLPFVQGGLNGLFGNPSSGHSFGLAARQGVDLARRQVAGMLGCDVDGLIFTSGGTEANNHAIRGVAGAYLRARQPHYHFGGGASGGYRGLPATWRDRASG